MNTFVVAIILVIIALLIVFLLGPFRLCFDLGKEDMYLRGFYKISFLGFTLKKGGIRPAAKKEVEGDQKHHKALASKPGEASEEEPGDSNYEEIDGELDRKPSRIPPQTQAMLLLDALPQIARIFIDLIKFINIMKFFCEISFGLDDPVDTAMVSGYLWSIASASGLYGADITIEPRFDGARLDGSVLAVLETRMLWFVVAAARALEEEKTRKLIFELVKGAIS